MIAIDIIAIMLIAIDMIAINIIAIDMIAIDIIAINIISIDTIAHGGFGLTFLRYMYCQKNCFHQGRG